MGGAAFNEQLALLPDYLAHHLLLTISALGLGILFCLPLAILVTRVKRLQWPVLTFASVMQTIPGIALLALMVPLLSTIGFIPALAALFLYSLLPILRNTVTGILGIDQSLRQAAVGLGMTDRQLLTKVELPLALPVIVAGIRTSAVWVVGTATLSTPVGATSLGNYIFSGLQTQNMAAVLIGCVAAALLAIVLDQFIRLIEKALAERKRTRGLLITAAMLILILVALSPLFGGEEISERRTIVIGSKPFTEQYILAEMIAEELNEAGYDTDIRPSMGSTILYDAIRVSEIDLYVDYSGTLWTNILKRDDILPRSQMLDTLRVWLAEHDSVLCLGPLGFENTYALACRQSLADSLDLESIADLAGVARQLSIGSDYEFFSRPEWASLVATYNLHFNRQLTFDPTLMYAAIREEKVDLISAYSTDGRIVDYDLAVLSDPRQALPPYDAVLLISDRAAADSHLRDTLARLIGAIDDNMMRRANKVVDVDGGSIKEAAKQLRGGLSGNN